MFGRKELGRNPFLRNFKDSLFRRLICYAVQKSSRKDRLRLFASHGFLSFEGHDCCIRAKLPGVANHVDELVPLVKPC